jgi:HK97 family phage major capsid protein
MDIEVINKAITDHADALKQFKGTIEERMKEHGEAIEKVADNVARIEEKGVRMRSSSPAGGKKSVVAAVKSVVASAAFAEFRDKNTVTTGPMEMEIGLKALTSLQGSPETPPAGYDVERDVLALQTPAQVPLHVLDVLTMRPTTSNTVGFPIIDFAEGSDADYQEGEGTEKTEAELASFWREASIVTIAVHTTLSKQLMDDAEGMADAIQNLLRYKLARKTDSELVSGDGAKFHIHGLLPQATVFAPTVPKAADRIGQAAATMAANGYQPRVAFVNPLDYFAIASERDADGRYIAGGWAAPVNSPIYNMQPVLTSTMPVGSALVFDPAVATVRLRQAPTVEASRMHNGNFTKNLVTILAELRLGLLVQDPAGLLKVSLAE